MATRCQRARSVPVACLSAVAAVCLWTSGCSESAQPAGAESAPAMEAGSASGGNGSAARLAELRQKRSDDSFSNKLAIGPGDLIVVSVPGVPELDKFQVRVSADSTITVPMAGVVPVGGMTEEDVRQVLYQQLSKPIKNPDVQVFVEQYLSREVAVVGMVQKPGLYSITTRNDTLLDMINQAGGMNSDASSLVLFIPASPSSNLDQLRLAKTLAQTTDAPLNGGEREGADLHPAQHESAETPDRIRPAAMHSGASGVASSGQPGVLSALGATDAIDVNLATAARDGGLSVPVRPGDTIVVPPAGEVMVDGWVANPGAFHIAPGMTALSAVTAAGGALFSQTAEVLRTDPRGGRTAIPVDLAKVKAGQEVDVPVQAGDMVVVQRSVLGAVPYAFYTVVSKFAVGAGLPLY